MRKNELFLVFLVRNLADNFVTVKGGIVKMTRSLSGTWEDNLQLTVLLLVKAFALLLFPCFFSHCTVNSLEQKFLLIVTLEYREYRGSPRWLNLLLGKILVLRGGADAEGRNLEDEFVLEFCRDGMAP